MVRRRQRAQMQTICVAQIMLDRINNIEPEHIKFTKEEEKENKLAVLKLELYVNRK